MLLALLFVTANAGRPVPSRMIAVMPVGAPDPAAVEALVPALRESFGSRVIIAAAVPLPAGSHDRARRQHRSTRILDTLAAAKNPEWDRLLGVADVDLYVPELNFVFGEGDRQRGVAVFSLARLKTEDVALFQRRAATEAIHELGHADGLTHCDDPHCVMWFSNTLAESDRKGTRFCARHRRELDRLAAAAASR